MARGQQIQIGTRAVVVEVRKCWLGVRMSRKLTVVVAVAGGERRWEQARIGYYSPLERNLSFGRLAFLPVDGS